MTASTSSAFKILLVEDNEADVHLVERALRKSRFSPILSVVDDGIAAVDFLRRRGAYTDVRRPDLVLLDLNIPGKDGHQVLEELKNDPEFKELPIVIYTSSTFSKDVKTSYRLGANAHVRKPIDMEEFFDVISTIEKFWFQTALLPSPQP